jgi:hypothetical protein
MVAGEPCNKRRSPWKLALGVHAKIQELPEDLKELKQDISLSKNQKVSSSIIK